MKTRRHHNNKGLRQVKRGKTRWQVKAIARRLGIPYRAAESTATSNGADSRVIREKP